MENNNENNKNNEFKDDMHNIYKGAKEYVSDKDNQEKLKKTGKKGLKILAGIGIGYLVFVGIIIVLVIVVFSLVFSQFFKISKQSDEIKNKANDIIDQSFNEINDSYNKKEIKSFNSNIESYNGTQEGSEVIQLLDNIIIKIKKNVSHSITVTYGNITTTNTSEIISLKKQFDEAQQYEVTMDYDSDGYINKVTILDY